MSHPKQFAPLGGQGRGAVAHRQTHWRRVVQSAPLMQRDEFLRWWSGVMMRRCGSAHAIAMQFDVTEQTGRNWIDGFSCPQGYIVKQAQELWPEEFAVGQGAR